MITTIAFNALIMAIPIVKDKIIDSYKKSC